jgi:dUTP pyrophosphatase
MTPSVTSGDFVAEHLNSGDFPEERIQPNGVDLGIEEIHRTSGNAHFFDGDYDKPKRTKIVQQNAIHEKDTEIYSLGSGPHIITYDAIIEIPDGYVGHVYPRSRLMRCGLQLETALWDQGYEGQGEGLLHVPRSMERVTIPTDMAVAQMVFFEADQEVPGYDGSHQGESFAVTD